MSNQVYIPPINFNENENFNSSTVSINAIEPLEYNKLNSNLSIKAATENNYGVITTGTQTFKGLKTFSDSLTVYTGSVLTDPTNDTDISNKKYVDTKTTDLVKYNTSTKYLIDNKTNSNINNLKINSLSVLNAINTSSASVSVSTSGYHGTDTKTITVYKAYVNGLTVIIFNKNTEINEYHWVSEIAMNENGMVMDFSNFSDIYSNLPQMFELKGEVSTYGGNKHIATKTLKFVKSSGYKYTVQYDKSFPMNLFKLKESIKNTDTYIFTSEANKIGTLTIDKGYLYNSPTENNNLVNKKYVDNKTIAITEEFKKKDTEIINSLNSNVSTLNGNIENAKTELNENIESAKSELNGNITTAISNISSVSLTNGTISTTPSAANDIANKKYVDFSISDFETITNSKINSEIGEALSNLRTVNLTTGTISTTPTNDTDITNKKFVLDEINKKTGNVIRYNKDSFEVLDSDNVAFNLLKFNNFVQIDNDLKASNISSSSILSNEIQAKTNLNSENFTTNTATINNSLNLGSNIIEFKRFSMKDLYNSSSQTLTTCSVVFFKIKNGNNIFINIKLNFNPFISDGSTLCIKNLRISDIGSGYGENNTYLCVAGVGEQNNYLKSGRCEFYILKNDDGTTYNIEIRKTADGDKICKFDDFECAYDITAINPAS